MTILLIVEKNGNIKETKVKNLQVSELYKKAGFKSEEGFLEPIVSWPRPGIDLFTLDYQIQVFGKTKGRAGQENKYDFPPPIDTTLFFGNVAMIAVRPNGGEVVDLTMTAWEMIYEQLFGGFEDLVDSHGRALDDSEEESEEDLTGVELTKEGYVKDDFIVDDDEEIEEEEIEDQKVFRKNMISDSDEEEDSEFEHPKARKNKNKKNNKNKVEKVAVEKKVKKVVVETAPPSPVESTTPEPDSEEDLLKIVMKKERKPRVVKAPKEPKVKKVKEAKIPKEKPEPKVKKTKNSKKYLDEYKLDNVYTPIDTVELEEEKYV